MSTFIEHLEIAAADAAAGADGAARYAIDCIQRAREADRTRARHAINKLRVVHDQLGRDLEMLDPQPPQAAE